MIIEKPLSPSVCVWPSVGPLTGPRPEESGVTILTSLRTAASSTGYRDSRSTPPSRLQRTRNQRRPRRGTVAAKRRCGLNSRQPRVIILATSRYLLSRRPCVRIRDNDNQRIVTNGLLSLARVFVVRKCRMSDCLPMTPVSAR